MRNKHITTSYSRQIQDSINTEESVSGKISDGQLSIRFLEQSARYLGADHSRKELIMSYVPG